MIHLFSGSLRNKQQIELLRIGMQALELLLGRRSQPRLETPPPSGKVLDNIIQAGLAAPDHKCLTPWRFVICQGKGLDKLGEIFQQAAINNDREQATVERAIQLPHRAPMVLVAICNYTQDEKVPRVEQIASTSCAVQSMQMAAVAQGFQGIWRTGWYAKDSYVKEMLECKDEDEIVGFLYLGSSKLKNMKRPTRDAAMFVEHWD